MKKDLREVYWAPKEDQTSLCASTTRIGSSWIEVISATVP
jgi:hypothetical protein